MKEFWVEHRPHIIVVCSLCGHQLTLILMGTEVGEKYYFVLEVLHAVFIG